MELVGKERNEVVKMNKSVNHLVKPLPKMVYTGLRTGDGVISYTNPEFISNPSEIILSLGSIEEEIEEGEEDDVMKEILDFDLLTLPLPEDDMGTAISIILPSLLKDRKAKVVKIGDTTFLIQTEKVKREKRYLWWDKVWTETSHYILSFSGGEIRVSKLKV